jgi:hypothetical protein
MTRQSQEEAVGQEVLAAALLWLRNHYDIGKAELKPIVLARIDAVLERCGNISQRGFREQFPVDYHPTPSHLPEGK